MGIDMQPSQAIYIVTGTTRGIGRALAERIIGRGGRLFTLNRRSDRLEGPHRNVICDLSDAAQVQKAAEKLFAAIDWSGCSEAVLINNAGVLGPIGPLEGIEAGQAATHLHTNLCAPIQLISRFIALTPDTLPSRRIINITSGAARHAYAGWSLYGAAKAAVNMITAAVALEQAGRPAPVSICAVAPGVVDTDMQEQIRRARPEDFPMQQRFIRFQAEGGLSAPEDVAEWILELDGTGQFQSGGIYDLRHARRENGKVTIASGKE